MADGPGRAGSARRPPLRAPLRPAFFDARAADSALEAPPNYALECLRKAHSRDAFAFQEIASRPRQSPFAVEIEVLAVGLNFKDVMKATGLCRPASPRGEQLRQAARHGMLGPRAARRRLRASASRRAWKRCFSLITPSRRVADARLVAQACHLNHAQAVQPCCSPTDLAYYALQYWSDASWRHGPDSRRDSGGCWRLALAQSGRGSGDGPVVPAEKRDLLRRREARFRLPRSPIPAREVLRSRCPAPAST